MTLRSRIANTLWYKNGATGRDRTGHLHVTNVLLCQMSYSGSLLCLFFQILNEIVYIVVLLSLI